MCKSDDSMTALEFVAIGTVCAVLAPESSPDIASFVKIVNIKYAKEDITDEYGSTIIADHYYIEGKYLLKENVLKNGNTYKMNKKASYLYKECIVYPFVNTTEKQGTYTVLDTELCKIESTGISTL